MSRLVWDTASERFFEQGVDRCVLYLNGADGVAWSGVESLSESSSGSEPKPYYLDGLKILNLSGFSDFEASITVLSFPKEFLPCCGISEIHNGLYASGQKKVSFGLSYRTLIGGLLNMETGHYKLHLIYNALATENQVLNLSNGKNTSGLRRTFNLTTMPASITGFKPTAHLIVDTRYADPLKIQSLENILYGTEALAATLPTTDSLITLFGS